MPAPSAKRSGPQPSAPRIYGWGQTEVKRGWEQAATGQDVLRALQVLGHDPHGHVPSRLHTAVEHPRVLLVGPGEQPRRVRDVRDQVAHLALGLGHRGDHERGSRSPRRARRASARRPAGRRRSPPARRPSRRRARRAARAPRAPPLGGEHRDGELDREALVAGVAPAARAARRSARRRAAACRPRTCRRCGRARREVAALHERGERLAQRRARDAELAAQLALGREPRAGLEQAELDRRPEPLERLLERGLRPDGGEQRLASTLRPSFTTARTPARAPSRSRRPRTPRARSGVVEVVVDDLLAERLAGDLAEPANASRASRSVRGTCGLSDV